MEITLEQILTARENRAAMQKQLLETYRLPLICFTMNIAGPFKHSYLIEQGFLFGHELLMAQLHNLSLVHWEHRLLSTGCEGYYVVDADPLKLKQLCADVEDSQPVARLFDMDVIHLGGSKINRETLGYPPRRCLLCENPVYICSSRRAHSVQQLQQETNRLLQQLVWQQDSRHFGALAAQSLLYEVCTTPKPGLVDCQNSGSHRDMDIFTFMASTAILQPYFTDCALTGLETAALDPQETFRRLRLPGKAAEKAMLRATGGVNTHKGAIFSLGVLCAAAGRLDPQKRTAEAVCNQCSAMLRGITQRELDSVNEASARTVGETLYLRYGITGIRGQAEQGFPAVLNTGLPVFEQGLALGYSQNQAGCATLLHLFCADPDTTFIHRSDLPTQRAEAETLSRLLSACPYPNMDTLQQLDARWTKRNLSAGGSADLLAITYFLHFLSKGGCICT